MRQTYSILAPAPVTRQRQHSPGYYGAYTSGAASPRRWLTTGNRSNASWLFAMGCLVLGVPAALATSVYLLSNNSAQEEVLDSDTAGLELPSLPTAADYAAADQAGAPEAVAVTDVPETGDDSDTTAAEAVPADPSRRVVRLAWGDTIMGMLVKAAVSEAEAHDALASLKGVYDPRDIQAGEEIIVHYNNQGGFDGFEFEPAADRTVRVERNGENFKAASIVRPLSSNVMAASIEIDGSLYESGIKAGIPASTMSALVKALSFSIDFQRDIQPGNRFKVMYEVKRNPEGVLVRTGDILYAEVKLNDRTIPVYRYRFSDGRTEFFDRTGQAVRKALMRTPVNAARISSGFGMRNHPIMGYSRMHKGVDFAAPTGTPIYAAGDGVILERGWKSGFGNFILIRHNGTLATAYGHMSRFNASFSRGSRVKQGQVIGYVGSTGNSTGPHLHFEVRINGVQVNPLKVANMSTGEGLRGANLERLKRIMTSIDQQFATLPTGLAQDVSFSALTGEAVSPANAPAKRLNN